MTLAEFLASLTNGATTVTVLDNDGTELIKFFASGYQQLLTTTLERDVDQITLISNVAISVKLAE